MIAMTRFRFIFEVCRRSLGCFFGGWFEGVVRKGDRSRTTELSRELVPTRQIYPLLVTSVGELIAGVGGIFYLWGEAEEEVGH